MKGKRALVMGLGLNGGGLASAVYLARAGCFVTVTDLRGEAALAPSIAALETALAARGGAVPPVRYVLGEHRPRDFAEADLVIKNPAVRRDSPFLAAARHVETDISLFLKDTAPLGLRIVAVTGSKGKSGTASAIHWGLEPLARAEGRGAWLGGNITVSPLSFAEQLGPRDYVVLELSSWQLGDLRGRGLLKPRVAVVTAIMPDHQDYYHSMEAYVADKKVICEAQDAGDALIAQDDIWGRQFLEAGRGRPIPCGDSAPPPGQSGGWLDAAGAGMARLCGGPFGTGEAREVVPARPLLPGPHQKRNLLAAALALLDLGAAAPEIRERLGAFPGIEHRLECFLERGGVRFYNDSAATIPEAAAAAIAAFREPLVLVSGGTDKALDFAPLARAAASAKKVILLAGTGSEKLRRLLEAAGTPFEGPFDRVEAAAQALLRAAAPGDVALFSPGCTSFGMFQNEFDRGRRWKETLLHAEF